jgi:TRAP-type uncharacterized transport system fused permease subunit
MSEQNNGLAASPSDWPKALFAVALLFSIFQIATAAFHPVSTQVLRAVHVGFLLLLVFISFPALGKGPALAAAGLAAGPGGHGHGHLPVVFRGGPDPALR